MIDATFTESPRAVRSKLLALLARKGELGASRSELRALRENKEEVQRVLNALISEGIIEMRLTYPARGKPRRWYFLTSSLPAIDEDTGEDLTHLIAQSLGDKGENTILQAISSQPGITRSHLWSTPLPIHGWVGVCIRNLLAKGYIKERVDIDASGGLRRTYWITEKAPITE